MFGRIPEYCVRLRNCVCVYVCDPQWAEYVLFAGLLICVCIIFSIMAHFYTYIDPAEIEAQLSEYDPDDKKKNEMNMDAALEEKQTKI